MRVQIDHGTDGMQVNSRFYSIIRDSLQGWQISLLMSICLSLAILVSIFLIKSVLNEPSYEAIGRECSMDEIAYTLNLIAPSQLGITQWQVGRYANYRYNPKFTTLTSMLDQFFGSESTKARLASRDVKFHIVAELATSGGSQYWMKATGLAFFRSLPRDIYRLASHADLRITPDTPRYDIVKNYVPLRFFDCDQTSTPLATLVKLGEEEIETPVGRFHCIRYRVEFGTDIPPIEIWANPKVLPLGIVRISTPSEVLNLTSYGQDVEAYIPEQFQTVITGISTLNRGCTSCHAYDNCHEFISPPQ